MNLKKELVDFIKSRRSVRKYESTPVDEETIREILKLAFEAPSAGNQQPWKVYVTSNPDIKEKLVKAAWGQSFIKEAPWVLVVCALPEESGRVYGDRGRKLYCIQDTAALIVYIMFAARIFDLDTCWVGAFSEDEVVRILDLPAEERPVAIIPVGKRGEIPRRRGRKEFENVVKFIT